MVLLTRIRNWLTSTFPDQMIGDKRAKRFSSFMKPMNPTSKDRVLDIGVTSLEHRSSDNFFEKHYTYPKILTALGIENLSGFKTLYPKVGTVVYDGSRMPFRNKCFDICFCNAVIEHAGDREKQTQFLMEIKLVAKRIFLSTPNRSSPVEIHTKTPLINLLLPKHLFYSFLRLTGRRWATGRYMNLLSIADMRRMLEKTGLHRYRIFGQKIGPFTINITVMAGQAT